MKNLIQSLIQKHMAGETIEKSEKWEAAQTNKNHRACTENAKQQAL